MVTSTLDIRGRARSRTTPTSSDQTASRLTPGREKAARSISREPKGAHVVVKVRGELDAVTARQLSAELAARDNSRDLVIDLSELTFVDSSGVHVLTHACAENETRVVCPNGIIRRVLEIVSFSKVAPLYVSLDEALAV
jgi:anti-anti-sigma factor